MSHFIQLANGSLLYPKDPPMIVTGFYQDPLNKKLFHPDFIDCKHRKLKHYIKPCKKIGVCYWCNYLQREVTARFCDVCDVEPKE